uniref:RNase H type-1 domain-containing protein n=1 Tax=Nelumbo nucifera TaxID=4432 RepID=A0A822Y1Q7_NELNU|nr:TPA_asm: hypothetical protein HUJ06_026693 [Nelumbo nucifera]
MMIDMHFNLSHIFKEGNAAADGLENVACDSSQSFLFYSKSSFPRFVQFLLFDDTCCK